MTSHFSLFRNERQRRMDDRVITFLATVLIVVVMGWVLIPLLDAPVKYVSTGTNRCAFVDTKDGTRRCGEFAPQQLAKMKVGYAR
jgi:hypothetical protein